MSFKRFNAQIAQYKTPAVEGNGFATWDSNIKSHIPSATIYGACKQETGVQTVYGSKNIFDKSLFADGYSLGGYYPGTYVESYKGRVCSIGDNLIEVKPNTTYTISVDEGYPYRIAFVEYSSEKGYVLDHGWKTVNPITFTTQLNTKYLWVVTSSHNYGAVITLDEVLSYNWQIEESPIATSYVPYSTEVREVSYPSPDLPSSVKCNNGTFSVCGRNILSSNVFDISNWQYNLDGSGYWFYAINVPPGTTVTVYSIHEVLSDMQFYMHIVPSQEKNWMYHPSAGSYMNNNAVTVTADNSGVIMLRAYGIKEALNKGILTDNLWAAIGDGIIPYEPYFDGGSVKAPDLYGIPDTGYQDEWNPVTGVGIRRCGRVVLDGNHDYWGFAATTDGLGYSVTIKNVAADMRAATYGTNYCISTHHKAKLTDASAGVAYGEMIRNLGARHVVLSFPPSCTSVELCKAWLAEQYNAGTPVTLIYDLATPVTFYSEPTAKLIQPNGYGTLVQMAGDVLSCPVSVKYLTHS